MKQVVAMDTREKLNKKEHILSVFNGFHVQYIRTKLYVGDWTLLNDQSVCIDTKTGGLQEVYSNLVQEHERFREECIRARDAGIRLIVLVEDPKIKHLDEVRNWVNPRDVIYRKQAEMGQATQKAAPVSSERLYKIMRTMSELYGVEWAFTSKARCGETILDLLGVTCDGEA